MKTTGPRLIVTAGILSATSLLGASAQVAEPASAKASIKYTLAWGRGWSVCEAYLKSLNARRPGEGPPLCSLNLDRLPEASEPKWEELDIAANLPLVHQIELLLGKGNITPEPERDFEQWKRQRELRMKAQGQTPRLRRVRMPLAADGPVETVLSYDLDVKGCEKAAATLHRPEGGFHGSAANPNFFLFDEARKQPRFPFGWASARHKLFLYLGRPYYIAQYIVRFGDDLSPGKLARVDGIDGSLFGGRLEPLIQYPDDPRPDWPPYSRHELCKISFEAPASLVRHGQ